MVHFLQERNIQTSRFFPSNFRFFRPTELMRIYHKNKSTSFILHRKDTIKFQVPASGQCHWNFSSSKRHELTDHQKRSDVSRTHTWKYPSPKIQQLTPNTNCINIPCIENFKLLCQQNCKEVKTIFSDPSDRQLQKQA